MAAALEWLTGAVVAAAVEGGAGGLQTEVKLILGGACHPPPA